MVCSFDRMFTILKRKIQPIPPPPSTCIGTMQAINKSLYTCNTERRKTRRKERKVLVLQTLNVNLFLLLSFIYNLKRRDKHCCALAKCRYDTLSETSNGAEHSSWLFLMISERWQSKKSSSHHLESIPNLFLAPLPILV
jgi:hypothetical protein